MDRLVSMGMSEQAVNELRITANRFQTLKANDAQLRESSQEHDEPVDLAPSSEVIVQKDPLTPKNVSIWLDQTEVGRPRGRQRIDDYLGLGYSLVLPPDHDQSSTYSFRPQPPHATINISPAAGSVFPDFSKLQKMDILNSAIPKEIRPPHIYSFQESSFARRIHRSCLEAGYSLLLDPSRNPPVYERVFKLSLLGRTRQDLITCMRIVLERGPNQPLELYDAPLIHIGGAGTYYPRKDRHGNNVNRKPTYNLGVVGPSTLQLLMQADEQRLTADLTAEIEGYEGEWFDAHDVEGYLQEKGVFVDPLSSFAEVEVQDLSDTSGSSVASSASPETPGANGASDIIRLASPWKPIDPSEVNAIEWNETELVSIGDFGYSDMDGKWVNLNAPARPTTVPGLTNPAKKTVMIDVAKFIRGKLLSTMLYLTWRDADTRGQDCFTLPYVWVRHLAFVARRWIDRSQMLALMCSLDGRRRIT